MTTSFGPQVNHYVINRKVKALSAFNLVLLGSVPSPFLSSGKLKASGPSGSSPAFVQNRFRVLNSRFCLHLDFRPPAI